MLAIGAVVADEIEVERFEQGRVDRRSAAGDQERVAVRRRAHDRLGAEIGAGARTVLDEKLLAEML